MESGRLTSAEGSAAYSGALAAVAPTVSLSNVVSPKGATLPVTITATESGSAGTANGAVVTFGVVGPATGSFSPTSCTIAYGSCSVSYVPDGTLAAGTYSNGLTASVSAFGSYTGAGTSSTLTIAGSTFGNGGTERLLASFTGTSGAVPGNGSYLASLIQASDGNFYGVSPMGGANDAGTIFKISPTGQFTLLHTFQNNASDGGHPYAGLIQGFDGSFYGTASLGGAANAGVIFKISASGDYAVLHSFNGDGANPQSGLVQGADGLFYGTTDSTMFKMTADGSVTFLHGFSTAEGGRSRATLVQGLDGNFYGSNVSGSTAAGNYYGTLFKVSSVGAVTVLHTFPDMSNGAEPEGTLLQARDGSFYGVTVMSGSGGNAGDGTIFRLTSDGNFTTVHSFFGAPFHPAYSEAGLIQGSDGLLYGISAQGGYNNANGNTGGQGALFQMDASNTVAVAYNFAGPPMDGLLPKSGLIQGSDGSFYGTSVLGGANSNGSIFKFTMAGNLAGPITLVVPANVLHGTAFTLSYSVSNANSLTLRQCFATNTAGDTSGWTGRKSGLPLATNTTLIAPSTPGTYTYSLTCGGVESGFATLNVQ